MSRAKRFTHSLVTGYGTIAVNILFTLLSIPLALSYLSKEEFGLWALALQINGYFCLIDLGMSGAVGRFLADHKDDVDSDAYASHFATGNCVFVTQSLLLVAIGMVFSSYAPSLLSISPALAEEFTFLLRILCVVSGLSIATRSLGIPLWAFQRMDVINVVGMIGLILQFATMWLGFHLGYGVRSFVFASIGPTLLAMVAFAIICFKKKYYPSPSSWFSARWSIFKKLFAYGCDGMLLSIGSQLVNATQITIISRTLGLDAAASFSIATKLYGMCIQLCQKVIESAAPGLTEMFVRGQSAQFVRRYWDMIFITLATSSAGAVALAAGNSAFIAFWTGGKVIWSIQGDFLLGLMVLILSLSGCIISVFGITKNLKPIRFLFFIEGLVFVPTAILAARWYSIEGIIAASIFVHLLVTFTVSARAASKILGNYRRVILPMLQVTIGIAFGSAVAWGGITLGLPPIPRLACAVLPVLLMSALAWNFIMPDEVRKRLHSEISTWLVKLRP